MYNKQTSMIGGHYDTTKFVEKVYNNKIFDCHDYVNIILLSSVH